MTNSIFDKFYPGLLDGDWCCRKCNRVVQSTFGLPTIEECPYCKKESEEEDGSNQ